MGSVLSQPSPTRLYFAASPVSFLAKHPGGVEDTTIRSFLEKRVPSVFSDFKQAWWLPGGHLQTFYCSLGDFSKSDVVVYERQYIRLLDGGTLGLDFTSPLNVQDDTPIIVVSHGLTGGSYESYIRCVLSSTCAPSNRGGLGYRACVVNFRGCAGVPITSSKLYTAGGTDDLRQALMYLSKRFPNAPLLGVGYSLGANIITRYAAEEGRHCRLAAACVMANPWDLAKNNIVLISGLIGKHVYAKAMGTNLLGLVKTNAEQLAQHANDSMLMALDDTLQLTGPTLEEFDHSFSRIVGGNAPPYPFETAMDYYTWSSSHKLLDKVRIPLLAINASDDPIVQDVPTDVGGNGWVALAMTSGGGHLGWFESAPGTFTQLKRWITKPVTEWLKAVGEDLVHETPRGLPLHEVDGFIKELGGRDDLGCKEVEGSSSTVGLPQSGVFQGL